MVAKLCYTSVAHSRDQLLEQDFIFEWLDVMNKAKLYCYVDETGQDTYGRFFLVAVIIPDETQREAVELALEEIENRTRKSKNKWSNTTVGVKKNFLQEIIKLKNLKQTVFYSVYRDTKKYNILTAQTVAKAIQEKVENNDYFATIIIDGLTKMDTGKMRIELKALDVKYKNIRGMRDEQSVFLRFADAMAGFTRDYLEGDAYTKIFFATLEAKGIIKEV